MHIYNLVHRGSDPRAPIAFSTHVSPVPCDPAGVAALVAAESADPWSIDHDDIRHRELTYPDVSDVPSEGVAAVVRRYGHCDGCYLCPWRERICFTKGNVDAAIVAVGEGPGRREDECGVPFCGPSGKLQDVLFLDADINPLRDVCWMNLVGCRPHDVRWADDRPPTLVEKIACSERTLMLLRALRPRVVLCLGEQATALFWDKPPPPNTWHRLVPRSHPLDWIMVGVTRHPAYLLRSAIANYRETFAARLFLRKLRRRLHGLSKTSGWRFELRYMQDVEPTTQAWQKPRG